MNYSMAIFKRAFFSALFLVSTSFVVAQTPFAGEDFDGGTTNGGFTAATYMQTPDTTVAANGNFTSGFDLWGILDPTGDGSSGQSFVPFDLLDESTNEQLTVTAGFADENLFLDTRGILVPTDRDKVFAVTDLDNPDNPSGTGTATWTFNIAGQTGIELSIDMAALGDFESSNDSFIFSYSIDGGTSTDIFTVLSDDTQSTTVVLETPAPFDDNGFFDEDDWLALTLGGGSFLNDPDNSVANDGTYDGEEYFIDYDPADIDQDGYIEVTVDGSPALVRTLQRTNFDNTGATDGIFENPEYEATDPSDFIINDPLYVNGDSTNGGIQVTNTMTTFTESIAGTGTTLTLTLNAASNGGSEYFLFDDIVLASGAVAGLDGDFNNDGEVDAADYTIFRDNLGLSDSVLNGNGDGDGTVDSDDYDLWAGNYGASSNPSAASASAVPEPAAALLMLCGVAGLITRRNA